MSFQPEQAGWISWRRRHLLEKGEEPGQGILGRGNCMCKGPEAGAGVDCSETESDFLEGV